MNGVLILKLESDDELILSIIIDVVNLQFLV